MPYSNIKKTTEVFESNPSMVPQPWQVEMCNAPCTNPGLWLAGTCCTCCFAYVQRQRILEELNMNYRCCGGQCCCFDTPEMPLVPCLFLESCCCVGFAVMGTRDIVVLNFMIQLDYVDEYLISLAAWLQCLVCIIQLIGIDIPDEVECIIDIISYVTLGCALTQQNMEIDYQLAKPDRLTQGYYYSEWRQKQGL